MTQVLQQFDAVGNATLAVTSAGLIALTAGLETMVLQSWFTNRRAPNDLVALPTVHNGWWADTDTDQIGSLLWLLRREPLVPATLRQAKIYAEQALAWMLVDGLAKSVACVAERYDNETIALGASIMQPDGNLFEKIWNVHRSQL